MLSLQKSAKELSWLVLPDGFFFIFFKLTLQNFFIMSKGTLSHDFSKRIEL